MHTMEYFFKQTSGGSGSMVEFKCTCHGRNFENGLTSPFDYNVLASMLF